MAAATRRNRVFHGLIALGLLTGVAATVVPAQADSGVAPFMPEPSWDRKIGASTRFLVLTNWSGTAVLDKETGLVWERSPDAVNTFTWTNARAACFNRTTGNRRGWRLPSVQELASLIDPAHAAVAAGASGLPVGHPFLTPTLGFTWSATTIADAPTTAWVMHMSNGGELSALKTATDFVWCVRGSMNADQY